jgi:hypothetical protein
VLALADAAGDDPVRLGRARDLLARSARGDPRGARGADARRALAEVERRIAALAGAPAVAPAHAEGGAEAVLPLDASHR